MSDAVRETRSTCPYCGVGCGVVIESQAERIVGVRGDPAHPANFGRLCSKGSTLHLTTDASARLLHPQMRTSRAATMATVSWDDALGYAARRFAAIIAGHGPDAVAFYGSGQLLTEDYYVFNKLAKGLIGTNNFDTNSRLCMSSAVAGYKRSLGADAPPACYEDIEQAQCLFIAGSNTAFAHPIVYRRIEDAKARNPELKVIVVDPRRTDTAAAADLHLPILPGTDVALFNGMLHVMLWDGLCDHAFIAAHTSGFGALKTAVAEYTPRSVASICGVPADDVVQAARWFAGSGATLSLYCQGLNQSIQGTDKNSALINLHLATGQIGRAGAGPFSLTGQPNAMGGREVGGMANLLSAHRDLANPAHRDEVARLWDVPAVPATPGKTAVELFEALRTGQIKAVWIACTNPVQSLPEHARVVEALQAAELVVLQEAFRGTETAPYADVLLPATTWGEKDGTVTNSERRISRARAAVAEPGEARHDWAIAVDFARRLGALLGRDAQRLFPYTAPEQIFAEHRESTRGRDLDITGLSYALLETQGPQQWPFPEGAGSGRVRLYEDGHFATEDGRARFVVAAPCRTAEATDARHPLHLTTGRLRDQWHGMSRTGLAARLFSHEEEPLLSMNPADMRARALRSGALVRVKSRRGEIAVRVRASDQMRAGQVYLPMHWGGRFMRGGGINTLTLPALDPISRQPELKHTAVQVEKLDCPWEVFAVRTGNASDLLERVQPLLEAFPYVTCGLHGRERSLLVFRAAAPAPVDPSVIDRLDAALGLDDASRAMDYRDARRGIAKRVLVEDGAVTGVRLTGETAARDWLKELCADGAPAAHLRNWVLAPVGAAPAGEPRRGRVLCNCLDVAERDIRERVAAGASLDTLQGELACGTRCGSCLPEIRRLIAEHAPVTAH